MGVWDSMAAMNAHVGLYGTIIILGRLIDFLRGDQMKATAPFGAPRL